MSERHQPTIDFLYSLMGHDPAAWPGLRAAGIPAAVQEWAAQDAARQQDLATVWADVCREQPYAEDEDMVSYTLDFFGPDVDYGWSPLVASAIWLTDNYTEGADCPELERVGLADGLPCPALAFGQGEALDGAEPQRRGEHGTDGIEKGAEVPLPEKGRQAEHGR